MAGRTGSWVAPAGVGFVGVALLAASLLGRSDDAPPAPAAVVPAAPVVVEPVLVRTYVPAAANRKALLSKRELDRAKRVPVPAGLLPKLPKPPPPPSPLEQVAKDCPTGAPEGTIRDGAAGPKDLCARSVLQARSVQAGKAIVYAFDNLGAPYSMSARNTAGVFDCTALIYKAYRNAGVEEFFSDYPYTVTYADPSMWQGVLAATGDPKPGDIRIMWRPEVTMATSGGRAGHGQIYLADGYVIQSGGSDDDNRVNVSDDDTWGWPTADFTYVGSPVSAPVGQDDPNLPNLLP